MSLLYPILSLKLILYWFQLIDFMRAVLFTSITAVSWVWISFRSLAPHTNPLGSSLFGSTSWFVPYCLILPHHTCQGARQWRCVPLRDERNAHPGKDRSPCLARGHPFPYFSLPAFQVEYITCTWLPRTWDTSSCQDRSRDREGARQTNGTALCPGQLACSKKES